MNEKIRSYFENTTEAGLACVVMMVQGDLISLTAAHWYIATQTGLIAGTITATALVLARTRKRWIVSLSLGAITAVVDFFIHSGMISRYAIVEAVLTGFGAAVLSYLFAYVVERVSAARSRSATVTQ